MHKKIMAFLHRRGTRLFHFIRGGGARPRRMAVLAVFWRPRATAQVTEAARAHYGGMGSAPNSGPLARRPMADWPPLSGPIGMLV
jgi:hypothetical protein